MCGRCGARMRVHYEQFEGNLRPYYICNEAVVRHAGKACQWARGPAIDEAVSALLLEAMAPTAIEVALAVQEEISQRVEQAASLRDKQLQRARYEAELARRRYLKVDPDNRLVADALEADWNGKLRDLDTLQREHERQNETDQSLLDGAMQERDCQEFCAVGHDDEKERIITWLSRKNFWTSSWLDVIHPRFSARTVCWTI